MTVQWALPRSRFTSMFESFVIEVLLMTQAVKGAMTILRRQWDATWHISERAVTRGKVRKEPSLLLRIGIDEEALAKGRKCASIFYNLDNSTVVAIEERHDTDASKSCFSQLSQEQLQSVEADRYGHESCICQNRQGDDPICRKQDRVQQVPFHEDGQRFYPQSSSWRTQATAQGW